MPMPKLSKKYIKRVASRFGLYAGGFVALALAAIADVGSVGTGIGVFLLIVTGGTIAFLPTIAVQLFNIKAKDPKPYFVEPTRLKLSLLGLAMPVCGFLAIMLSIGLNWPDIVVGALALLGFVLPINVYMVNVNVRYKRIVEYGTVEWHRLHQKRRAQDF